MLKRSLFFILLLASATGAFIFLATQNRQVGVIVERTKFQVREAVQIVNPTPTLSPAPTSKVLSGGYQTFQTFNNCGPSSLSMILSYFDVNISQHELGDQLRPYQVASGDNDDKSTTLAEMAHKAEELGFAAYYRPNGNEVLLKQFISSGIPVVARTWLNDNDYIGHYRVVKGYDDTRGIIIQDDSYQGANLEFTYEDFNKLWEAFNYEYLVIVRPEQKSTAETIIGENLNDTVAWSNAIEISNKELSADPDNYYAIFNMSTAYYHLGMYDKAIEAYVSVADKLPFRMLWYQIDPILAYQKTGQYDKVFEITDQLIQNGNRAFSEAYQIRAEVYEAQGKSNEASVEFEKVYQYNKNFFKYWK